MPTPTASEIIERVKARYAGCRSYEDTVVTDLVSAAGPHPWKPIHRTFRFRIAFRPPGPVHFLKVESLRLDVTWKPDRPQEEYSTPARLEADSKLNGHTWYGFLMGPLLIPNARIAARFLQDIELTGVTIRQMDERDCFVLSGRSDTQAQEVWVDADTSLVRRVETRDLFNIDARIQSMGQMHAELGDPATTQEAKIALEKTLTNLEFKVKCLGQEERIHLRPRMDHDIDPKVFEFVEPG